MDLEGIEIIGHQLERWNGQTVMVTYALAEGCRTAQRTGVPCEGCPSLGLRWSPWDGLPWGSFPGRLLLGVRRRECSRTGAVRADLPPELTFAPLRMIPAAARFVADLAVAHTNAAAARLGGVGYRKASLLGEAARGPYLPPHLGEGILDLSVDNVHPMGVTVTSIAEAGLGAAIDLIEGAPSAAFPNWQREHLPLVRIRAIILDRDSALRTVIVGLDAEGRIVAIAEAPHLHRRAGKCTASVYDVVKGDIPWDKSPFPPQTHANVRKLLKKDLGQLNKDQRALLRWIFRHVPILRRAYFAQLRFQRIFKEQNPKKAMAALDQWRRRLPDELFRYFKHLLLDVTENWRDEVKNYLNVRRGRFRLTNGFLEASHRQLKQRYRDGRGNTGFQVAKSWYLARYGLERRERRAFMHRHLNSLLRILRQALKHGRPRRPRKKKES